MSAKPTFRPRGRKDDASARRRRSPETPSPPPPRRARRQCLAQTGRDRLSELGERHRRRRREHRGPIAGGPGPAAVENRRIRRTRERAFLREARAARGERARGGDALGDRTGQVAVHAEVAQVQAQRRHRRHREPGGAGARVIGDDPGPVHHGEERGGEVSRFRDESSEPRNHDEANDDKRRSRRGGRDERGRSAGRPARGPTKEHAGDDGERQVPHVERVRRARQSRHHAGGKRAPERQNGRGHPARERLGSVRSESRRSRRSATLFSLRRRETSHWKRARPPAAARETAARRFARRRGRETSRAARGSPRRRSRRARASRRQPRRRRPSRTTRSRS